MQTWNPRTQDETGGVQEPGVSLGYGEWRKQAPCSSWASFWVAWLSLPGTLLEAPSLRPPLALNILTDQHMPRASRVCD